MNSDSIRSSLFATSSGSNRNIPMTNMGGRSNQDRIYAEQSERMMEQQNDELTNRLSEKVNLLKQLSIDIGVEVKEQNRMLNDMDADFENTQGFMKKTLGGMTKMMNSGSSKHMCYLIGFIFGLFLLVYWLVR